MKKKTIFVFLFIFLGLVSLVGAIFLVQREQETRRRAADIDVTEDSEKDQEGNQEDQEGDQAGEDEDYRSADLDCTYNCLDIYALNSDGNKLSGTKLEKLSPQEICFQVEGWTDCDQGINQARFKLVDVGDWQWGEYVSKEKDPGSNGVFYYYQWCYDFSETTEPCYDIDAQVCVEGNCR